MIDILNLAAREVGTREAADHSTKYGRWLDAQVGLHLYYNLDWCGSSLLYLISKVPGGLEAVGGLHREYAEVQVWFDWMKAHDRISHTAKPRRLVWYDWASTPKGANHIGLVKSVSGSRMKVYEGNHNNRFELVDRRIDSQVMGFGEWWSHIKQPVQSQDDVPEYVSLGMSKPQPVKAGVPAFAIFDIEYGDTGNAHADGARAI